MHNLKIVQKFKENISPRLRWLKFSNNHKITADYIEKVSGVELQSANQMQQLEAMVREQLKAEFPNIESSKSYELLVDAVMQNMMKKQINAMSKIDIK